jgi:hypothetical protein
MWESKLANLLVVKPASATLISRSSADSHDATAGCWRLGDVLWITRCLHLWRRSNNVNLGQHERRSEIIHAVAFDRRINEMVVTNILGQHVIY